MPQVPDVGGIAKHIRARIKQIEAQLKQHQVLSDELDRLRDALSRIEGAARSRVVAGPRGRRPAAKPAHSAKRAGTAKPASPAKRAGTAKQASPDSLSSINPFVTNGLGSGRPKAGPKVYSVIMFILPVAPISSGPRRHS